VYEQSTYIFFNLSSFDIKSVEKRHRRFVSHYFFAMISVPSMLFQVLWCHDIQHNDTQLNNIMYNDNYHSNKAYSVDNKSTPKRTKLY